MILNIKDKKLVTNCNHCGNKTVFNVNGMVECIIYPFEDERGQFLRFSGVEVYNEIDKCIAKIHQEIIKIAKGQKQGIEL